MYTCIIKMMKMNFLITTYNVLINFLKKTKPFYVRFPSLNASPIQIALAKLPLLILNCHIAITLIIYSCLYRCNYHSRQTTYQQHSSVSSNYYNSHINALFVSTTKGQIYTAKIDMTQTKAITQSTVFLSACLFFLISSNLFHFYNQDNPSVALITLLDFSIFP